MELLTAFQYQLTWILTFLGSWAVIGNMYHNYIVRKRLTEIRDAITKIGGENQ